MFMAKMGHQKTKTVDDVTHWRNEALFIHMNVGKDPLAPRLNAVGNFHFFRKGSKVQNLNQNIVFFWTQARSVLYLNQSNKQKQN